LHALNAYLDGYPPKIKDAAERRRVKAQWDNTAKEFDATARKFPADPEVLWRAGELYRMGPKLDGKGGGGGAGRSLKTGLRLDARSIPAHVTLGMLYVNTNPSLAPAAEKEFKAAKAFVGDRPLPGAQIGLFFAYYYQGKFQDAVQEVDAYLSQHPDADELK